MNEQWVSFWIDQERYVHSTNEIREVVPYQEPKPVPGSPDFILGILNVRGKVATVLGSRRLLGQEDLDEKDEQKILLLELDEELIGICVDSVGDIVAFEHDNIQWLEKQNTSEVITGTVKLKEALYIVTDFAEYCRTLSTQTD